MENRKALGLFEVEVGKPGMLEEALRTLRQKYFGEALANLITRSTPKEVVRGRPGRGKLTFRYVPVAWFINQLNSLFGWNWDFEIVSHEIIKDSQIWVKGRLTVRILDSNNQWITITKNQFGSSEVKKVAGTNAVIDVGDDLKSAASDCLKKCATLLGLAWDVYSSDREAMTEAGPRTEQLLSFYRKAEAAGMTMEEARIWFRKQTSVNMEEKDPEEVVEADLLGAFPLLTKLAKERTSG